MATEELGNIHASIDRCMELLEARLLSLLNRAPWDYLITTQFASQTDGDTPNATNGPPLRGGGVEKGASAAPSFQGTPAQRNPLSEPSELPEPDLKKTFQGSKHISMVNTKGKRDHTPSDGGGTKTGMRPHTIIKAPSTETLPPIKPVSRDDGSIQIDNNTTHAVSARGLGGGPGGDTDIKLIYPLSNGAFLFGHCEVCIPRLDSCAVHASLHLLYRRLCSGDAGLSRNIFDRGGRIPITGEG